MSIAIGALAAFALGGAVVGTLLPQLAAAVARPERELAGDRRRCGRGRRHRARRWSGSSTASPRGRILGAAATGGRWLMLAGIGGWLGYLLLSRLVLLVDRLAFLLGDWLGIGR